MSDFVSLLISSYLNTSYLQYKDKDDKKCNIVSFLSLKQKIMNSADPSVENTSRCALILTEDNSRFRAMKSACKRIIDKYHFDEVSQRFPEVIHLLSVLMICI